MERKELKYSEQNIVSIFTGNKSYSMLRTKLIYALGANEDAKTMADLLIYFINIEQEQIANNCEQMAEHNGCFLRDSYQIENELFLSYYKIRTAMTSLKEMGLIDYSRGGCKGVYRIKLENTKIADLLNDKENGFSGYKSDFKEQEKAKQQKRRESNKGKNENLEEKWKVINENKYKQSADFSEIMTELGYDEIDTLIISFISKAYWRFKHRILTWNERDLNTVRMAVIRERRGKNQTREQHSNDFFKRGNIQKMVDVCSLNDNKASGFTWSAKYANLYQGFVDTEHKYDEQHYFKMELKNGIETPKYELIDKDYYLSDINVEIEYEKFCS